MRDRTMELGHQNSGWPDEDEGNPGPSTGGSGEKENEAFFRKVQVIRTGLETLERSIADLEKKQNTVLVVALPDESMKKELQTLRERIKTTAGHVKKKLRTIEPKKGKDDGKPASISTRIQRTQHGVLSRQFVELMGRCNDAQAQYRARNVKRIQGQLKIAGTDVTDEELTAMLESGRTDVFTQNVLSDAQATRQALNDIESRHDEILKLEMSIKDLQLICQYIDAEVQAQGDTVNDIEANVQKSSAYVEVAKVNVGRAVRYKRKRCKKMCWVAVFLAILIVVLGLFLASYFGYDFGFGTVETDPPSPSV